MDLQIRLFGGFSLQYGGEQIYAVSRIRLQAFLAFLALHASTPLLRQQVAFTFWPDSTEGQARNNLRKTLFDLRQALPAAEQFLRSDAHTLHWRADGPFSLDVTTFDELIDKASSTEANNPTLARSILDEAVALYGGDLLPGCYDEWITPERERLRQAYCQALDRLMRLAEDGSDYRAGIAYANRLLLRDPLRESTYRRLMRLYAFRGDRASALRVYHTCVSQLQQELGVEPGEEIQAAYERILGAEIPDILRPTERRTANVSRLVGREKEWWTLLDSWDKAANGSVHFCLIRGESGIGKTRLAQELLAWVSEHGFSSAHTRAYEMAGALAYTPVIDWLQTTPLQAALHRLDDRRLSEISRLLPDLLLEHPGLPRPEPLHERWQRQRLFEALSQAFLACQQPLLLVLDDGQWCDADTIEWLHYLLEQSGDDAQSALHSQQAPAILIVCTARGEEIDETHPLAALVRAFRGVARLTEIDLALLDQTQTTQLATQISARSVDSESAADLFAYTGGNPLYVVETVADDTWEANVQIALRNETPFTNSPESTTLSPRLYALLHARLTHLTPPARQLASLGAVIGRAFGFDILRQASHLSENDAMQSLDELWRRGIVREQADGLYDFSHDRIREVAYAEVGPVQRPLLHRRVAQTLEAIHAADLDSICAQLGAHYEQAGDYQSALGYYWQAADLSASLYAFEEVIIYMDKALELLEQESATDAIHSRRVDCLLLKENALQHMLGLTSPERKDVLDLAVALSKRLEDRVRRFETLFRLRYFYGAKGEWYRAGEISQELLSLAHTLEEPSHLRRATASMGIVYLNRGDLKAAQRCFETVVERHNTTDRLMTASLTLFLAQINWLTGYPDQARIHASTALRATDASEDVYAWIEMRDRLTYLYQYLGDTASLSSVTNELKELCTTYSDLNRALGAQFMIGWLMALNGQPAAGLAMMQEHNEISERIGNPVFQPYYLALTAEVQSQIGLLPSALETLHGAKLKSEQWGDYRWLAEILRLTGEIQHRLGYEDAHVEASLHDALKTARQQGAKSLELRAAISLARIWQGQGKLSQAHTLLAEIYAWFSEGFDTPDLQEASALLAELAQTSSQ